MSPTECWHYPFQLFIASTSLVLRVKLSSQVFIYNIYHYSLFSKYAPHVKSMINIVSHLVSTEYLFRLFCAKSSLSKPCVDQTRANTLVK